MQLQTRYFGYNYATLSNYHEGKHDYPEHLHHFIEVLCVLEGEIEVTINGKTEIAQKGDLAVVPSFQPHSYHTPQYCRIWVGLISPTWITDIWSLDKFYTAQRNVFTPSTVAFTYIAEKTPHEHWKKKTMVRRALFRRLKALYYVIFEEYFDKAAPSDSGVNISAISAVYMYIYDHYRENITLKKVAAEIGYSPNYISSCLSAIPNANFRTILNSARVEHAKNLLVTTDMKIVDIALDSGFLSENVFYGIFEKFVGMTPRQYRLAKRNT